MFQNRRWGLLLMFTSIAEKVIGVSTNYFALYVLHLHKFKFSGIIAFIIHYVFI